MVGLVSDALSTAGFESVVAVIPPDSPDIRRALGAGTTFVEQPEPLGTGQAVYCAKDLLNGYEGNLLVINGDVPLVTAGTLEKLKSAHETTRSHVTLLTSDRPHSSGLGRVMRDKYGKVASVVEEKHLTSSELVKPYQANIGVYCFRLPWLWSILGGISPSTREIYLTDVIGLAYDRGCGIEGVDLDDPEEGLGVNDGVELATAREAIRYRVNRKWLLEGVTIMEPAYIDISVDIQPDTTIYPNTFLSGNSIIGRECEIGPGSIVKDSRVADGCRIIQSVLDDAVLEENVEIGPFSHLRAGSHIERDVHIGNFSEIKKSRLGRGTMMGHFSYIGDAWVGAEVNIGAGTVTCNFDGDSKNETIIEDGAFIGSDSMLVAPIRVGAGASTGAGSVVNKDVPAGTQVVGVPARPVKNKKIQKKWK
jgi:bifunctional UDP-N-acetylglucosamine pyrophosphorylase/glucosamine-1-phosphate N-acetyltransferase